MPKLFKKKRGRGLLSELYLKGEIDPDQVLIDAKNLPDFDVERLEGKMERPISKRTFIFIGLVLALVILVFTGKAWALQIRDGERYAQKSEQNRLHNTIIISERGVIADRNGRLLAWNTPTTTGDFPLRTYIEDPGFGHILGYVTYPLKDSSGVYYQAHFTGKDGVEEAYNEELAGVNGLKITETDARGTIESESVLEPPQNGKVVKLSVDARIQKALFGYIKELADRVGFTGGAGAIFDVETGEIIALTSYPEYSSQILTDGKDTETIAQYAKDGTKPYLDRAVSGLYTPGSIIKPFIAIGALEEKIIDPSTKILSTGSIEIPNPYDKTKPTIFRDWKAHGWVNMREAIAVSSDVYFYEIGGGFEGQRGLGIQNIEKYLRLFGFGTETGIDIGGEELGTIPNPAWKEEHFPGDPWRIGNTYHTAIGQYGMQTTLIQALRGVGALANGGRLVIPTVRKDGNVGKAEALPIDEKDFEIVREGMRMAVLNGGTAQALNVYGVKVAGKTGTAELGVSKQFVNSWIIGFFPYEKPRYAFAVLMEKGPRTNLIGAPYVMNQMLNWLVANAPEYVK